MNRPFYRSRLFWLGVPGLVFLLWCWWDSGKRYSEVTWAKPRSFVAVYLHEGRIALMVTDEAPTSALFGPTLQFTKEDGLPFSRGGHSGVTGINLFGTTGSSGLDERFEKARIDCFPGLYRRRWSFPYIPHPGFVGSAPWLPYREWGADFRWVMAGYIGPWLGAVVFWQRRKARIIRRAEAVGGA